MVTSVVPTTVLTEAPGLASGSLSSARAGPRAQKEMRSARAASFFMRPPKGEEYIIPVPAPRRLSLRRVSGLSFLHMHSRSGSSPPGRLSEGPALAPASEPRRRSLRRQLLVAFLMAIAFSAVLLGSVRVLLFFID